MKHPSFRSDDFWQAALMTLPDNVFFDLMRSSLGNIKTPFNKQKLMEDLCVFLSRPEIQKTVSALINDDDSRIIAAIALLSEPAPPELERFFAEDFSYTELHNLLLNLEERLIVYRFRDEKDIRIALNPRLEKALAPFAEDSSPLFPPADDEFSGEENKTELEGRLLAALFAFFLSRESFFRTDGNTQPPGLRLRKKILDEGAKLFPGIDLEVIAGALIILGVLVQEGEGLTTDENRLSAFKECAAESRLAYLAAGIVFYLQCRQSGRFPDDSPFSDSRPSPLKYISGGLLKNTARLVLDVAGALDGGKFYPKTVLVKRVELLRREETGTWNFSGFVPQTDLVLEAMEMTGLVSRSGSVYRSGNTPAESKNPSTGCIAFDSSFSFILYPEISFADALDLALVSIVEEAGTTLRFSVSKESLVRGFDRGCKADDLCRLFDKLSGGRGASSLKWNLKDWAKRYGEVALYNGVVMTLGGERTYLAEKGPLASMIKKELAPGVFLLNAESRDDAAKTLHTAGVDILAIPEFTAEKSSRFRDPFPPPGKHAHVDEISVLKKGSGAARYDEEKAEHIKETFRTILADMKPGKQEQEEMLARIERRMIVSESQLKDISIRHEKLEARSLDYVGKTAVVKQAIESGSLLELSWPAGGTAPVLGTPESLDKKGGELILVFMPREGQKESVRIPLGKISLVRRIKKSIFGE